MFAGSSPLQPELRVFGVNGNDVLSICGEITEASVMSVCERINERISTKSGPYNNPQLDLSNKQLGPIALGHLIRCFERNQLRPKVLQLSGNLLNDFDLASALGFFIESVNGRFLSELDLSDNRIGDFGTISILQSMVSNKMNSSERKITIVRLNNNFITHPARILEAIPQNLRNLVYAPGIAKSANPADIEQALIYLYGLDDQRVPRAKRDCALQQSAPAISPWHDGIREPDDGF